MATHRALVGNCADVLKTLPNESVDCCVTSPPYWGLRDYKTEPIIWDAVDGCEHEWENHEEVISVGHGATATVCNQLNGATNVTRRHSTCSKCGAWRGQLGLEPTPQLYIKHLVSIFDEVRRVLKPSGTCWVNLGDTYASRSKGSGGHNSSKLPDKCLVQIPSRFALAMTDSGWILRNELIWHKPNCMPSSVKDRFTVDFEKLFFFTKSKSYYFEQQFEAYRNGGKDWGADSSGKYCGTGLKDYNGASVQNPSDVKRRILDSLNPNGHNKRTVWTIPTQPYSGAHFAVFPPELIETPIKAGCPKDGVVLDPFGGSGTTAKVARNLGRSSIIIELNPSYLELQTERALLNVPDITEYTKEVSE